MITIKDGIAYRNKDKEPDTKPKRVARPPEERIMELQRKREQLRAREQELKRKTNANERKKRTKRLIELGAVVENLLGERVKLEELDLPAITRQIELGAAVKKALGVRLNLDVVDIPALIRQVEIGATVEQVFKKPITSHKIPDFEKWLTEVKTLSPSELTKQSKDEYANLLYSHVTATNNITTN